MKRMGHNRKQRQEEAVKRQYERDRRTPVEQLAHLDSLLGANIGAKKERARLNKQIEKGKTRSHTDTGE